MAEVDRINSLLEKHAPAAWRCLSPLGRRAAFPTGGILAQTGEAKDTELNATIGQITDGAGHPLPLPTMSDSLSNVDEAMAFLYSPQPGRPQIRKAWKARQRDLALGSTVRTSLPIVTHGLTQGLSLVSDLFADPDTEVIIPSPYWGNYKLIFDLRHGAKVRTFPFFDRTTTGFNVEGLREALASVKGKAILILNIPGNPTGFTPAASDVPDIVHAVANHPGPLTVVCDDAYQGMVWEDGLAKRSLFWDIAEAADPERHLVIKLDGATKEFFFFPGRLGFITIAGDAEVEDAFSSKIQALGRCTVGSPPGPSQALLLKALRSPTIDAELESNLNVLRERFVAFKKALEGLSTDRLVPYPFNSGMFGLIGVKGMDAERVRRRALEEENLGVIAIDSVNGVRVSYGSTRAEDLAEVVARLERAVLDD